MKIILSLIVATVAWNSLASCAGPDGRANYETPPYQAIQTDGSFEVREYPAIMVASAPMNARQSGQNSAFMDLFGYISGKNEKNLKIPMTTPVFGTMNEEENSMSFVVPAKVVETGVPEASNSQVKIAERAAGRFAAYRYSGRWSRDREEKARAMLVAWMKAQDLSPIGKMEKASYDPPFTLPSLRRNEVLVRIKP
jgi:hypothetical protein